MAEGATDEMTDEHRDLLKSNLQYFMDTLQLKEEFYVSLLSTKVLTRRMYENVKKEITRREEIKALLQTVERRGNTALNCFIKALRQSVQHQAADHFQCQLANEQEIYGHPDPLEKRPIRVSEQVTNDEPDTKYISSYEIVHPEQSNEIKLMDPDSSEETYLHKATPQAEDIHRNKSSPIFSIGDRTTHRLHTSTAGPYSPNFKSLLSDPPRSDPVDTKLLKVSDFRAVREAPREIPQESINTGYPISTTPCGLALIISVRRFTQDRYRCRDYSKNDVQRLRKTLETLGFEVISHTHNLKKEMFTKRVDDFLSRPKHNEYDCAAMFFMSHGEGNAIITADCVPIPIVKLMRQFSQTESLDGKPKLIGFQMCRTVPEASDAACADTPEDRQILKDAVCSATGNDMLVIYSTLFGTTAWYDERIGGTWLIQTLCDVLDKYAPKGKDTRSLILKVKAEVAKLKSEKGESQTVETHETLLQRWVFQPRDTPNSS